MPPWQAISRHIGEATGQPFHTRHPTPVGGGCINDAWLIEDGARRYFVKTNSRGGPAMFEAEAAGLVELARPGALRVPHTVCHGAHDGAAYLVLEYLELGGTAANHEALGWGLAQLHRTTADRYGWHRDNTLGATPQPNGWLADWTEFWRERRLRHQLHLLAQRSENGDVLRLGERLLGRLPALLAGHRPAPSLLHGDLWSGNAAFDAQGRPVIFDPAVYYGDREADLAMTELFGGFSPRFYAAYRESWPVGAGYTFRRTLYNLHHILNHANLFGGGYASQASHMMQSLLAEAG